MGDQEFRRQGAPSTRRPISTTATTIRRAPSSRRSTDWASTRRPPSPRAGSSLSTRRNSFPAAPRAQTASPTGGYLYVPRTASRAARALPAAYRPARLPAIRRNPRQRVRRPGSASTNGRTPTAYRPLSAGARHDGRRTAGEGGRGRVFRRQPYGCWNWWGYAKDPLYLTKSGVQVGAIWAMAQRSKAAEGKPRAIRTLGPRFARPKTISVYGRRRRIFVIIMKMVGGRRRFPCANGRKSH